MDFRLLSNRLSVGLPLVAGSVAGLGALLLGRGFGEAVASGVEAGGASFLAWAVTRELDPDHPPAASVAAVLAPLATILGSPALAVVAVWLLAARTLAGTTGAAPYTADMLGIGGFAVWASTTAHGLPLALLAISAVALSTLLEARGRRTVLIGVVAAAGASFTATWIAGAWSERHPWSVRSAWCLLAVAAVTGAALLVRVGSATDRRPVPIETRRVRVAIAAVGAACALAVVLFGPTGLAATGPLVAALGVTALFSVPTRRSA